MLLLYILWDDWTIFMISGSNGQLQQQLEYTYLNRIFTAGEFQKCNLAVRTLSKNDMQWNSVLNLEKMSQKRMKCFRLLLNHLAWIEHQFLSGIRDSRKAGSLWERMKGVGGVRKSIHQSRLAKGLGLVLLCWGFKEVQEDIPWEDASTVQIGSVAPGKCTSMQLHPCHRLFDQDGHQDSSSASLKSRPWSLWLLLIP